jgi:hypothetical protein
MLHWPRGSGYAVAPPVLPAAIMPAPEVPADPPPLDGDDALGPEVPELLVPDADVPVFFALALLLVGAGVLLDPQPSAITSGSAAAIHDFELIGTSLTARRDAWTPPARSFDPTNT